MFSGQFRFSENLTYGKKFAKITFADCLQWPVCNCLHSATTHSCLCGCSRPANGHLVRGMSERGPAIKQEPDQGQN